MVPVARADSLSRQQRRKQLIHALAQELLGRVELGTILKWRPPRHAFAGGPPWPRDHKLRGLLSTFRQLWPNPADVPGAKERNRRIREVFKQEVCDKTIYNAWVRYREISRST